MRIVAAVVAFVACVHAGLWALQHRPTPAPDFNGQLASVSYSPYARSQHPDSGDRPTLDQIRADLRAISPYTQAIRTYSSTGGVELVPQVAANFGLKVTVGAWIDKNENRNEAEIRNALDLAKRYSNVNAIVVGNETTLRAEKSVPEMIKLIQRVKRTSPVPVTTGEIWTVWLDHPELATAVDFIAAHILPYWEGVSDARAVDNAIAIYDKLRAAFPGKRIVIAEFGWPSAGYNYHNAYPSRMSQAMILRDFAARAETYGIDYNIIEAIDQPWKTNEGAVGRYWGIFDAQRDVKFNWAGPLQDTDWQKLAIVAVLIGFLFSLPLFAMNAVTMPQALLLVTACNVAGMWFAVVFEFWKSHYFVFGAAFALGFGLLLLLPLIMIAIARIEEISAIVFGTAPRRLVAQPQLAPEGYAPKVSIHIPAYREPPEMLKATLDAVARLDYANFECVVVINNTPDPAYWRPIEDHCALLGDRFKFLNVDNLAGFKAGALRLALAHTAPDAEIVGVIDADYAVKSDWLKDLVSVFADPKVGLIQAPQDHRDGSRSLMHTAMNGEYAGFFDIGMVQRNEVNAIIVHGTMCLIRREAIVATGGWSSDTIVEDTDLGMNLLERGWQVLYTNKRYGHGLLPDTFEAYKKQRYRWAYGSVQLIKKHWRELLPRARRLSREQRREFAFGWLNWLGAESLGVGVAILNLFWVPVVAFWGIAIPDLILTIPILAAFAVSLTHFILLYRMRVDISLGRMLGSVITAMSVQWTVARAVGAGVFKDGLPFLRTAKGGATRRGPDFAAYWEALIGALLILGALVLVMTNYKRITEINVFAAVLVVQSLPFLAAAFIAAVEGTRFNEFAYWTKVEEKIGGVVLPQTPQPAVIADAAPTLQPPMSPQAQVHASERHVDPVK